MSFDNTVKPDANEYFNFQKFSRDVFVYFIGQGVLFIFGVIQFFIIPKYLSIEDYGYWQLFILYGSYVGVLHFGFIDGILIRWGGRKLDDVKNEMNLGIKFLLIEQSLVVFPLIILSYFLDISLRFIVFSVLIYAFFVNLTTFFTFSSQAVKKFTILTAMIFLSSLSFLILIILGLLYFGLTKYYVIIAQICSYITILVAYIYYYRSCIFRLHPTGFKSMLEFGKKNINIGIFVLFGNFCVIFFFTIDRLIVSSRFSITEFAIYAFALTGIWVIYTFIQAFSSVLFPHLAGLSDDLKNQLHSNIKPVLILAWATALIVYFPFTRFIEFYLPQYLSSLPIMQILLATVGFGAIINILHVNYYKTYKKTKQYFLIAVSMLGLSFVLTITVIRYIGTLESIAGAMLVSYGLWFLINEIVLKNTLKQKWIELIKSIIVICCFILVFFCILYFIQGYIYQIIIYLILFIIITSISYISFIKIIYNQIKHYLLLIK